MSAPVSLSPSPRLDQVRAALRRLHYSYRTEHAYLHWIRRFIFFHGKRHPREMGEAEVAAFLTHLAVERRVSASTQNQALNAVLFFTSRSLAATSDWFKAWSAPSGRNGCRW